MPAWFLGFVVIVMLSATTWGEESSPPEKARDSSARALLAKAADAASQDEALNLAGKAIEDDPSFAAAYVFRGRLLADARRYDDALGDYDRALKLQPDDAAVLYWRGRARFCAGNVEDSLEDFDRFVELRPELAPRQWERGIALYYAGRYEDGAAQFALYQTYHDNDVENATWRYLCMAQTDGIEKARRELLPIENDRRNPMMQIYALYRGELKPDDVLAATERGEPSDEELNARRFYAHLYLGLYFEAAGNAKRAQRHIDAAVKRKIGHYMWDVAAVHQSRRGSAGETR